MNMQVLSILMVFSVARLTGTHQKFSGMHISFWNYPISQNLINIHSSNIYLWGIYGLKSLKYVTSRIKRTLRCCPCLQWDFIQGLPWWLSGKGYACQCKRQGLIPDPNHPHAEEQSSPQHNYWVHAPQQKRPLQWKAWAPQLENSPCNNKDPAQLKIIKWIRLTFF